MKKPTETALVRACLDLLRVAGVFAWRTSNHAVRRRDKTGREFFAFHGLRGQSDIIGALPGGKLIAVEVKAGRNKPSPDQETFANAVRGMGGVALTVWSVQELEAELRNLGLLT